MAIETTNVVQAAARITANITGGRNGVITPPNSPNPPYVQNFAGNGVAAITKVATGQYMVELEASAGDSELICQATLHGAGQAPANTDALVPEFYVPTAPQPSIYGGTREAVAFRGVNFTGLTTGLAAFPLTYSYGDPLAADLLFIRLPVGQN